MLNLTITKHSHATITQQSRWERVLANAPVRHEIHLTTGRREVSLCSYAVQINAARRIAARFIYQAQRALTMLR